MLNIRQTPLYADFMQAINWQVEKIGDTYAYIKKIPLLPAVIKIQRPSHLPTLDTLKTLAKRYGARSVVVEPSPQLTTDNLQLTTISDPFIHTKTIHIDLTPDEQTIFNRFTSAKRRSVRRAQKLGVKVDVSDKIGEFINLKNRTTGFFLGFLTTRGITRPLWNVFNPHHAQVVLAKCDNRYVAGILLLYINRVAYYWMAAATITGKQHFAPTLLVWEALKFAKNQGCTVFDFEGVFDDRFPKKSRDWRGFSRFKEGFGGESVYYPQPFRITL